MTDYIKSINFSPEDYSINLIIGSPRSGKTSLIKNLLNKKMDKKSNIFLFSSIEKKTNEYIDLIPFISVYDSNSLNDSLLEIQKKLAEDKHTFLIFDDFVDGLNSLMKHEIFNNLYFEYKKNKVTMYITCEVPLTLRPSYRSIVDYVLLLSYEDNDNKIKRLYDLYGTYFDCYSSFKRIYAATCREWNYLIIDCKTKNNEKIFYSVIEKNIENNLINTNDDEDDTINRLNEIIYAFEKLKNEIYNKIVRK